MSDTTHLIKLSEVSYVGPVVRGNQSVPTYFLTIIVSNNSISLAFDGNDADKRCRNERNVLLRRATNPNALERYMYPHIADGFHEIETSPKSILPIAPEITTA
jgi:hypothetical protein